MAKVEDDERFSELEEGFTADSTIAELAAWWLQHVARHRVRPTTLATYHKQVRLIVVDLGAIPARQLRPEQGIDRHWRNDLPSSIRPKCGATLSRACSPKHGAAELRSFGEQIPRAS